MKATENTTPEPGKDTPSVSPEEPGTPAVPSPGMNPTEKREAAPTLEETEMQNFVRPLIEELQKYYELYVESLFLPEEECTDVLRDTQSEFLKNCFLDDTPEIDITNDAATHVALKSFGIVMNELGKLALLGPKNPVATSKLMVAFSFAGICLGRMAARGNGLAGKEFMNVVNPLIRNLNRLPAEQIAHFQPRSKDEWPMLLNGSDKGAQAARQFLKGIALGEESTNAFPKSETGKRPDPRTPVNRLATNLVAIIAGVRTIYCDFGSILPPPAKVWAQAASRLPAFDAASVAEWVDVAWACLMDKTNNYPEDNPMLKELGQFRSNVRAGIRERLAGAMTELAGEQ